MRSVSGSPTTHRRRAVTSSGPLYATESGERGSAVHRGTVGPVELHGAAARRVVDLITLGLREAYIRGRSVDPGDVELLRALGRAADWQPMSDVGHANRAPATLVSAVMSAGEVAGLIGCSARHARRRAVKGRLPANITAHRLTDVWVFVVTEDE